MTHDNRGLAAAGAAVKTVTVAAADGAGLQTDQNLALAGLGGGNLFISQFFILMHHKSFHGNQAS
jgi:hypothetical protein